MRLIILFFVALLIQIPLAFGQYSSVEQVEEELKNARKDKDKLGIYVKAANSFRLNKPEKALEYSNKAIALSKDLSKKRPLRDLARGFGADAYSIKGIVLMNKDQYKQAEPVLGIAINARKGLKLPSQNAKIAGDYRRLGVCIENQGRTNDAYSVYKQGLTYANKSRNKEEIARMYYSLGKAQSKRKEYKEALISLGKAEENAKQANLRRLILDIRSAYDASKNLLSRSQDIIKLQADNAQNEQKFNLIIEETEAEISSYQDSLSTAVETNEMLIKESEFRQMQLERQELQLQVQEDSISAAKSQADAAEQRQKAAEEKSQKLQVVILASVLVGVLLLWMVITLFQRGIERKRNAKTLAEEKEKSENLLLNILPPSIAADLKEDGKVTPKEHNSVTILFTDFQGFTSIAAQMGPTELLEQLEYAFKHFDQISAKYRLEKIKTIGDAYMAVGGLVQEDPYHGINAVAAGMEMQGFMYQWNKQQKAEGKPEWKLRIGIHTGKVVAGVIGQKKFAYDIWGDAVNIASRMESAGEPGKVNISEATYQEVEKYVQVEPKRTVPVKNRGEQGMYFVRRIVGERIANTQAR